MLNTSYLQTSPSYLEYLSGYLRDLSSYVQTEMFDTTGSQKANDSVIRQKLALPENIFIGFCVSISRDYVPCRGKKCKILTHCYVLPNKGKYQNIYPSKYPRL